MRRENSGNDDDLWRLMPRGVKSKTPKSEHSAAWRQGYCHYRIGAYSCLYLDKQMSQDYDAGFNQAEKDEAEGVEWRY